MSGEVLGRRLLRLDAGYCAGAGLLGLSALALVAPSTAARLLLAAVALEVAAFAAVQVAALRR